LSQIKNHSDHWQKELSVPSKYMTIFLFPTGIQGCNNEESKIQFKNSVKIVADEYIKTANYFL
jgi:hypothetical protein